MTEKLYYKDSYLSEFTSRVISCEADGDAYIAVLDKTAFFPEGGGQSADTGTIGDVAVLHVFEKDGVIYHKTDKPLVPSVEYFCKIDFEKRFRRMQNHTGEHIVSGTVHRLYGFSNVGFHMGHADVTLDFDGVLDADEIRGVEKLANEIVASNRRIGAGFYSREQAAGIEYRSKKDVGDDIRIVEIENCDRCACCAPHVRSTSEVGIIKLLDFISYKGGVRIHMQCGLDALDDYNRRCDSVRGISVLTSVPQAEVLGGVKRLTEALSAEKSTAFALRRALARERAARASLSFGAVCIFEPLFDAEALRFCADVCIETGKGIYAVFSGSDESGYTYALASRTASPADFAKEMNLALGGRGGGSKNMVFGNIRATQAEAENFFGNKNQSK